MGGRHRDPGDALATTKSDTENTLHGLDDKERQIKNVAGLKSETAAIESRKPLREAEQKDKEEADAKAVANQEVPIFQRDAQGTKNYANAHHDAALLDAAKALDGAATAAKDHATPETLSHLKAAAENLKGAMEKSKVDSKHIAEFAQQIAELTRRMDGAEANRNNGT